MDNLPVIKVLLLEDEVNVRRSIKSSLLQHGYHIHGFDNPKIALRELQVDLYDVVIADIRLGEYSGLSFFQEMLSANIDVPVIVISGNASLQEAALSIQMGAYDFIEKPFATEKLLITLKNCLEKRQLQVKIQQFELTQGHNILGEHPSVKNLRKGLSKIASSDSAVLIHGETGTGKELIAKQIHQLSRRANNSFVTVNCSAIPISLIQSALFGHLKGAYTGADGNKKGYFETANHGTLFLDEIADLPLDSQASLLRTLEYGEIQKVGSDLVTKVDVRILAATHKNIEQLIDTGQFRQDLFYRINVIPVTSPALRDRASDIPLLTTYFLKNIALRLGSKPKEIDIACYPLMKAYAWPGNVRELLNTIERMVILGGDRLNVVDLPKELTTSNDAKSLINTDSTLKEFVQQLEREYILQKLRQYSFNVTDTAEALKIDRTNLHKKMDQYDIKRDVRFK